MSLPGLEHLSSSQRFLEGRLSKLSENILSPKIVSNQECIVSGLPSLIFFIQPAIDSTRIFSRNLIYLSSVSNFFR